MENICPVCGFSKLFEPPYNEKGYGSDEICPCCGFQFGLDDYPDKDSAIEEWRSDWILRGRPWFSNTRLPEESSAPAQEE